MSEVKRLTDALSRAEQHSAEHAARTQDKGQVLQATVDKLQAKLNACEALLAKSHDTSYVSPPLRFALRVPFFASNFSPHYRL